MIVYKITKVDDGQSFYSKSADIEYLFDNGDVGEEYSVKSEEMSEEDFEGLSEFEGF